MVQTKAERWERGSGLPWLAWPAWGLASGGFLLVLLIEPLGARGTVVIDDYACFLSPAVAGAACWRASRVQLHRRRAWRLLALSCLSWAGGGLAWAVMEVYLGQELPFPSLADAGYLLQVPLAVASLLIFQGSQLRQASLRSLLDGVVTAASLLFVSWSTVLGPVVVASEGPWLDRLITLAYPLGDVVTATIALLAMSSAVGRERATMLLIGVGLLTVAVADSSFAWFTAQGDYATGNLFDSGYVAGFLMVAVAAFRSTRAPELGEGSGPVGEAHLSQPTPQLATLLPYAPLVVSLPLSVAQQLLGQPLRGVPFYLCVFIVVVVLLRQLMSVQVNQVLSAQLHETVAALRNREAELEHQAFHDPLTGLANRALFADRVSHALGRSRRTEPVVLLLADLDGFKSVNDSLGHPAGDALLVAASERLRGVVRRGETVARLGGDEFAVLLESGADLGEAERVAERIVEALAEPFVLGTNRVVVGASVGVALAGASTTDEELLREADMAMYAAKINGKGGHAVYAVDMAGEVTLRRELQTDLGAALECGQLSLKYQPVVDLAGGEIRSVEALLRWSHPVHGEIAPARFIPLAEESGEIVPIGRWVLSEACAEVGRMNMTRRPGSAPVRLAVNLSGRQLADPGLVAHVVSTLADTSLPASLLTLEITESVMFDEQRALVPLCALRELGVRLAIDDFGTGHSALSRLRRFRGCQMVCVSGRSRGRDHHECCDQ